MNRDNVQTIEKTGKVWKGAMVVFGLMAVVGFVAAMATPEESFLPAVGGFGILGWIGAKVGAWWFHG